MTASMTAMRMLIVRVYRRTGSVLLTQLMHASSTGFLMLAPSALSAAQDTLWYAAYAAVLWIVAAMVGCAAYDD